MNRNIKDTNLLSMIDVYKLVLSKKLNRFPNYTWSESDKFDNSAKCTRYMLENILKWDKEEIKKKLSLKTFQKNRLSGMMGQVFGNSPYAALNNAYPGEFKPWELYRSPANTWDKETSIEAFKWMIEERLKWSEEDIKEKLTLKVIIDNSLGGMMETLYSNSPFAILDLAYPDRFKPWELLVTPLNTWNKETSVEAFKWLVDDKLKWTEEDIKEKLTSSILNSNGLASIIYGKSFNNSFKDLFEASYPNINSSEVKCFFHHDNKDINHAKRKIREVIYRETGEIKEEMSKQIDYDFFIRNQLGALLKEHYGNSPYKAVNDIYPGLMKTWEIGANVSKHFWEDEENIKSAVRWLVEEKLRVEPRLSFLKLTIDSFADNNLGGLLQGKTVEEVLKITYPNEKPCSSLDIYKMVLSKELPKYPAGYWDIDTKEKAIEILKYVIDTKLKLKEEEIYNIYNNSFLKEYRLIIALRFLNCSNHNLINMAYPNRFMPWRFSNVPSGYWTNENIRKSIVLQLSSLGIPIEDWKGAVNKEWIYKNGLGKILRHTTIEKIRIIL